MVWVCDEKRGALCRKEGDGNESTGEKEERKTKEEVVETSTPHKSGKRNGRRRNEIMYTHKIIRLYVKM